MGDNFTIQISSDLIRRLNNDPTRSTKPTKVNPKSSKEHRKPQSKETQASTAENITSPGTWPHPHQIFLPASRLPHSPAMTELEAIRSTLQESEGVLEKLEKQEANMVQQLTERAKELHEKEFRLPYQKPMPCSGEREDCLQCYKENLEDPLKCAPAVQKFADCVSQARRQGCSEADQALRDSDGSV